MLENYPRVKTALWTIVTYTLKIYVAYTAYKCNRHESAILKYGVPLIAFYYTPQYFIYYILYHRILLVSCSAAIGTTGVLI